MLTALLVILATVALYMVAKSVAYTLRKGRATNVDWSTPETIRTVPASRHGHYAAR